RSRSRRPPRAWPARRARRRPRAPPRCPRCRSRSSSSLPPTTKRGPCGILETMGYPRMLEVRQRFDAPRVDDVAGTVAAQLERIGVRGSIRRGETVAVAVGSRGITNLALVVRTLVAVLKEAGARPFVVPAIGSHGGATAEGQRAILAGYGITDDAIGAPIRSSIATGRSSCSPGAGSRGFRSCAPTS